MLRGARCARGPRRGSTRSAASRRGGTTNLMPYAAFQASQRHCRYGIADSIRPARGVPGRYPVGTREHPEVPTGIWSKITGTQPRGRAVVNVLSAGWVTDGPIHAGRRVIVIAAIVMHTRTPARAPCLFPAQRSHHRTARRFGRGDESRPVAQGAPARAPRGTAARTTARRRYNAHALGRAVSV